MGRLGRAAKSGDWLTRKRVMTYSGIALGLELIAFLFLIAGTHGWVVPLDKPNASDFVSFYAAGELANAGTPEAAYLQPEHFAAEQRASEPGVSYVFFFYPPVFLLLCAPFARLPYLPAFLLFEGSSLIFCLFAVKRILAEKGWAWLLPVLAFPAIFINLGLGQNAFLTAALFGGGTLLVDRRPFLAGVLFGALCYKPHLGLLIPVALLAAGRWRSIAGAAGSAATLIALSAVIFGWRTWHEFLKAIGGAQSTYRIRPGRFRGFRQPLRRFAADGMRSRRRLHRSRRGLAGGGGAGCVGLAAGPRPAGARCDARRGDAGGRSPDVVLRSDAGDGCNRLAHPRRQAETIPVLGKKHFKRFVYCPVINPRDRHRHSYSPGRIRGPDTSAGVRGARAP